ncbi:hypothetical protein [Curtobacterium sp. SL109]|uniref:hypothetical protein n=1 Tax=Curtobacterium sp. SL109 TaxID=2994662 RepID=UPI002276C8CB|nr:hypothetical protein [Curtobacterium sp. SL109]MCY1695330.1 hypothetical protein [Curtobacterium sp. SL109]
MQRFNRAAALTAATLLIASGLGLTGLQAASASAPTPIGTGGVLQILSPNLADRGTPLFADGTNVQRLVADTARGIDARMTMSPTSTASFTLTPPDGKPLAAGSFRLVGPQQADFAAVPTLTINGDYVYGAFDILDVASNPTDGTISRFDALVPGVGEFHFGEDTAGTVVLGANSFSFKKTFIGLAKPAEQVETVHNTGTTTVALGSPSVTGINASSFSVTSSTCRTTLAAGAGCTFRIGFAPKTAGPLTATVTMKIGTATRAVPLTGAAYLGTTSITSSGKDMVNKGKTTSVNSSNTAMTVGAAGYGWTFNADRLDGSGSAISVHVEGPYRQPLAVGTRKTT